MEDNQNNINYMVYGDTFFIKKNLQGKDKNRNEDENKILALYDNEEIQGQFLKTLVQNYILTQKEKSIKEEKKNILIKDKIIELTKNKENKENKKSIEIKEKIKNILIVVLELELKNFKNNIIVDNSLLKKFIYEESENLTKYQEHNIKLLSEILEKILFIKLFADGKFEYLGGDKVLMVKIENITEEEKIDAQRMLGLAMEEISQKQFMLCVEGAIESLCNMYMKAISGDSIESLLQAAKDELVMSLTNDFLLRDSKFLNNDYFENNGFNRNAMNMNTHYVESILKMHFDAGNLLGISKKEIWYENLYITMNVFQNEEINSLLNKEFIKYIKKNLDVNMIVAYISNSLIASLNMEAEKISNLDEEHIKNESYEECNKLFNTFWLNQSENIQGLNKSGLRFFKNGIDLSLAFDKEVGFFKNINNENLNLKMLSEEVASTGADYYKYLAFNRQIFEALVAKELERLGILKNTYIEKDIKLNVANSKLEIISNGNSLFFKVSKIEKYYEIGKLNNLNKNDKDKILNWLNEFCDKLQNKDILEINSDIINKDLSQFEFFDGYKLDEDTIIYIFNPIISEITKISEKYPNSEDYHEKIMLCVDKVEALLQFYIKLYKMNVKISNVYERYKSEPFFQNKNDIVKYLLKLNDSELDVLFHSYDFYKKIKNLGCSTVIYFKYPIYCNKIFSQKIISSSEFSLKFLQVLLTEDAVKIYNDHQEYFDFIISKYKKIHPKILQDLLIENAAKIYKEHKDYSDFIIDFINQKYFEFIVFKHRGFYLEHISVLLTEDAAKIYEDHKEYFDFIISKVIKINPKMLSELLTEDAAKIYKDNRKYFDFIIDFIISKAKEIHPKMLPELLAENAVKLYENKDYKEYFDFIISKVIKINPKMLSELLTEDAAKIYKDNRKYFDFIIDFIISKAKEIHPKMLPELLTEYAVKIYKDYPMYFEVIVFNLENIPVLLTQNAVKIYKDNQKYFDFIIFDFIISKEIHPKMLPELLTENGAKIYKKHQLYFKHIFNNIKIIPVNALSALLTENAAKIYKDHQQYFNFIVVRLNSRYIFIENLPVLLTQNAAEIYKKHQLYFKHVFDNIKKIPANILPALLTTDVAEMYENNKKENPCKILYEIISFFKKKERNMKFFIDLIDLEFPKETAKDLKMYKNIIDSLTKLIEVNKCNFLKNGQNQNQK